MSSSSGTRPAEDHGCAEIIGLFSRLKKRVVKSEPYLDQGARRFMLVVTIEPKDAETIMEDLFETGLPRDVLYYVLQGVASKRQADDVLGMEHGVDGVPVRVRERRRRAAA